MAGGSTFRAGRGGPTVGRASVGSYVVSSGLSERDGMTFFSAHQSLLDEINAEIDAELQEAIHAGGKAARSYARSNSPKRSGKYARSFSLSTNDKDGHHTAVVSNRKFWMLTHLLDDDHKSYNQYGGPYGTVDGDDHLKRANDAGRREIERILGVKL